MTIEMTRMDNPVLGTLEIRASDAALLNGIFGLAYMLAEHPDMAVRIPDSLPLIGMLIAFGKSGHCDKFQQSLSQLYSDNLESINMERTLVAQEITSSLNVPPELQAIIDKAARRAFQDLKARSEADAAKARSE